MEIWIVGGFSLIALGVLIFSLIKGKITKNKKWFVVAGLLALYILACLGYWGLDRILS
jgi:hypothetical protein